ncbi:hypothetical protein DRE_01914 [Drechslerella stenobrocha 248]|uniref:Hemerythrin-like domain-containing protein n=1 Tax=Drechslerella stenobrocha 248 TaxID=1043628 RepID=W7I9D9_9PEZI|nr:hypothetical protein DRE_01914 [Drechslerella stenobrocha 248]
MMAAEQDAPLQYTDYNAEKFPEPVEPLSIDKFNLSAATVDMKDPVVASTIGLFTVHALVRRSLRSVARQARSMEPARRAAFLPYLKFAFATLDSHHHHEEDLWFPAMKPYVDFAESSQEHEEIESLLHQNLEHFKTAEAHVKGGADAPAWPGEEISATTERLLELLVPHLAKEETLACLYARRVPLAVYEEFEKKIEKMVMDELKKVGLVWGTAFQLRHWSAGEKEIWPPMPYLVRAGFEFFGWLIYGKNLAFGPTDEELRN